ncbi:hypothetical protein TL16_g08935 [Triparma laevis f. inornata]|uniref:Peptidase C1A papain C-terminal domain-containing protein n=1 Tax=Triparma laevis f. inornata TaxID=1714386 RepID=A0A9W7EKR9_9STRA|nr:hypothetical protein TL16_g08935 [Triparma laevis f. inornata]
MSTVDDENPIRRKSSAKPVEIHGIRDSEMVMRASTFKQSVSNERKLIIMSIGAVMLAMAATLTSTLTIINTRSVHAVDVQSDPATSSASVHSVMLMNNHQEPIATQPAQSESSLFLLPHHDAITLSNLESLVVPTAEGETFVVKVAGIQKYNSTHMRVFGEDDSTLSFAYGDVKYFSKDKDTYTVDWGGINNAKDGRRLSWAGDIGKAIFSGVSKISDHFDERFESFKQNHGKVYADLHEELERLALFLMNLEKVAVLNAELEEAIHGITKFMDWTDEEFQTLLGYDSTGTAPTAPIINPDEGNRVLSVSGQFNWNDNGKLTPVKDQGACGSCWAFSATETIETAWAIHGNPLTVFAPQQLVSCDGTDGGCDGGMPSRAFEYIKNSGHGMCTESAYPYSNSAFYHGKTGTCTSPLPSPHSAGALTGYGHANSLNSDGSEDTETIMAILRQYGPMSIAIDASQWNSYTGGVMDWRSCSSSSNDMDHAVQLVGYNADASTPYWIVRNTWSTDWGYDGFIRLKMGENTCGIANLMAVVTGFD